MKLGKINFNLATSVINSFVADSNGITFKLENGSFITLGYGDTSEIFDDMVEKYKID